MNILLWIIFGALAGWIADIITSSKHGLIANIVLGVIGAFVGGFVFNFFGAAGVTGFNIYSILVAIIGAIILIGIGRLI